MSSCTNYDSNQKDKQVFKYPGIITQEGYEKEFDNAAWLFYSSMNIYSQECYNIVPEKKIHYSIVETEPNLINKPVLYHDTLVLGITSSFKKDSIPYCGPKDQFGTSQNTYFIEYWFKKNGKDVIFRSTGRNIRYLEIKPLEVMFNLQDSVNGIDIKDKMSRGIYPLDLQEKMLIDTIRANKDKLSPWFREQVIKRKISL